MARGIELSPAQRRALLDAIVGEGDGKDAAEKVGKTLGTSAWTLAYWIAGISRPFESQASKIVAFLGRRAAARKAAS